MFLNMSFKIRYFLLSNYFDAILNLLTKVSINENFVDVGWSIKTIVKFFDESNAIFTPN